MDRINSLVNLIIGQSISTDSIVFCIGPELSIEAGARTIQDILLDLGMLRPVTDLDLSKIDDESASEWASETFGRDYLISNIIKYYQDLEPTQLYKALAKSPIQNFITTNFDALLEKAMVNENIPFHILPGDTKISYLDKMHKTIVKLAGSIDSPETLSLTSLDQKSLQKSPIIQQVLRSFFATKLVIFIGFPLDKGLRDFYERYWLDTNKLNNWIVFTSKFSSLDYSLWNRRGVTLIDFENEQLTTFVDKLSARINQHKVRPLKKKSQKQVFISGGISNSTMVYKVQRLLIENGFKPVMLKTELSQGITLSEKFNALVHESEAAIVIVEEDETHRDLRELRGNQLFELGYLIGALGREKVLVIQNTAISLSASLSGAMYIIFDYHKQEAVSYQIEKWLARLEE